MSNDLCSKLSAKINVVADKIKILSHTEDHTVRINNSNLNLASYWFYLGFESKNSMGELAIYDKHQPYSISDHALQAIDFKDDTLTVLCDSPSFTQKFFVKSSKKQQLYCFTNYLFIPLNIDEDQLEDAYLDFLGMDLWELPFLDLASLELNKEMVDTFHLEFELKERHKKCKQFKSNLEDLKSFIPKERLENYFLKLDHFLQAKPQVKQEEKVSVFEAELKGSAKNKLIAIDDFITELSSRVLSGVKKKVLKEKLNAIIPQFKDTNEALLKKLIDCVVLFEKNVAGFYSKGGPSVHLVPLIKHKNQDIAIAAINGLNQTIGWQQKIYLVYQFLVETMGDSEIKSVKLFDALSGKNILDRQVKLSRKKFLLNKFKQTNPEELPKKIRLKLKQLQLT